MNKQTSKHSFTQQILYSMSPTETKPKNFAQITNKKNYLFRIRPYSENYTGITECRMTGCLYEFKWLEKSSCNP
jgi:hypothetical protein